MCPYYYWCAILFTYIIHCIVKYFKPCSLRQFYKFLGYLHSFIHQKDCKHNSYSAFHFVPLQEFFSIVYGHLHDKFCSYKAISLSLKRIMWLYHFRFHWCFKIDDKRGNVNLSEATSQIVTRTFKSLVFNRAFPIFILVCWSKHFSSHQFGHTYFTLTFFFPQ